MPTRPPLRTFSLGAAFFQSARSFKAGWPWFVAAIIVLRAAPRIALTLFPVAHYSVGSHAIIPYLDEVATTVGLTFAAFLSFVFIISVCLEQAAHRPARVALTTVLRALPLLVVAWLLTDLMTFVSLGFTWLSPGFRGANLMALALEQGAIGLSALFVGLVSLVGFGLLPAVMLAEGRGLLESAASTWRLMEGIRWKLLGLFLLAYLPNIAVLIFNIAWSMTMRSHLGVNIYSNPYVAWGSAALLYAAEVLWAVLLALSYLERTRDRAGLLAHEVAHVFA